MNRTLGCLCALALASGAARAFGGIVIVSGGSQAHAEAHFDNTGNGFAEGDFEAHEFSASGDGYLSEDGFSGMAFGSVDVAFHPPNPGIGGTFRTVTGSAAGFGAIEDGNPLHGDEGATGGGEFWVQIIVDELTPWSWKAQVDGISNADLSGNAMALFRIFDAKKGQDVFRMTSGAGGGGADTFSDAWSAEGVLEPGNYQVGWFAWGTIPNEHNGNPWVESTYASARLTGTFAVPAPGAVALAGACGAVLGRRPRR